MNNTRLSHRARSISLLSAGGDCALPDACVNYVPGFLTPKTADGVFDSLIKQVEWHQPKIKLFGKTFLSPRLSAWYGDAGAIYSYSGLVNQPLPWLPALQVLRRRLKNEWEWNPNAVLVNWYRDGQDSMGWHSDDETELGTSLPLRPLAWAHRAVFCCVIRRISICLSMNWCPNMVRC